jgi:hypothetical protein
MTTFYFSIRDSPNLEGQIPVFISPTNRVARLYPQAQGSLFVASYDSQGYGGGIRPRLGKGSTNTRATIEEFVVRVVFRAVRVVSK